LVLIVGVGAAIYMSVTNQLQARRVETVRGLIGSEKEEFFQDERVVSALRRNGLEVVIQKAGSREISTSFDLSEFDYAFPAGVPAAEKVRQLVSGSKSYNPFFTPMTIASWRPIADLLVANGFATEQGGYYTLDMVKYMDAVARGVRWSDLENNTVYDVNKRLLINSTDIRKSNSAAMYLSLASYIANDEQIVQNLAAAQPLLPVLESLFFEQGFTEYSSEAPFEDYLVMGMGKAPLVMIYEAQFLHRKSLDDGSITDEMVLIYPEPTIFTKHILVSLSPGGEKLGVALETDPDLIKLAIEYGLRNNDVAAFRQFVQRHNLPVPDTIVNVIEPPSYETLEGIILEIERKY
jgi:hypothetical protein